MLAQIVSNDIRVGINLERGKWEISSRVIQTSGKGINWQGSNYGIIPPIGVEIRLSTALVLCHYYDVVIPTSAFTIKAVSIPMTTAILLNNYA